jgi:hypothetical protein
MISTATPLSSVEVDFQAAALTDRYGSVHSRVLSAKPVNGPLTFSPQPQLIIKRSSGGRFRASTGGRVSARALRLGHKGASWVLGSYGTENALKRDQGHK